MSFVLLFVTAFSMGLLGSPHCLGMCGGIVTAFGMSMQSQSANRRRLLIALYHIGRLMSYSLLGLLAGTVGTVVIAPLLHSPLPRILLGGVLVLIGLSLVGLPLLNQLEKLGLRFWQVLLPLRRQLFPLDNGVKALVAGLLWGFLPCGLVYGALLMAIAGHDVLTGAGLMLAFGLGTLPMLLATQTLVGVLRQVIGKFHLRQINGILLVVSGVLVMTTPLWIAHMGHSEMSHSHAMAHTQPAEATAVSATAPTATNATNAKDTPASDTATPLPSDQSPASHSKHTHDAHSHSTHTHSIHSHHE